MQHDLRSCSRPNPARPIRAPRVRLGSFATTLHPRPRRENQRGVSLLQPTEQRCGPVGRPAVGLPRLNKLRADVEVTGEHGLGHLEAGPQPFNAGPVYRRRWRWQLGCSQLPLALGMLESLVGRFQQLGKDLLIQDRKSTRLNSSHGYISYAVFCLKKKKPTDLQTTLQREFRRSPGP